MAQKKWLIRDIRGRIRGPYSTTNILDQIASGAIVGDEHLSPFPGNTWVPIAQDPEFYDRLLSLVARESTEKADTQSGKERGRAVAVDPNSFNSIQDSHSPTPISEDALRSLGDDEERARRPCARALGVRRSRGWWLPIRGWFGAGWGDADGTGGCGRPPRRTR